MKKTLIISLIIVVIVCLSLSFMLRPTIHNANYSDIIEINGFGEVLTARVVDYIQEHPNCDIDDLINVKGVGETKLFKLKVRFR